MAQLIPTISPADITNFGERILPNRCLTSCHPGYRFFTASTGWENGWMGRQNRVNPIS